jgi:hypothetical protein
MDWLGPAIVIGFSILIATIILNVCGKKVTSKEGFASKGPEVTTLPPSPQANSDVAYLPNAPINELSDAPLPAYDPAYPRTLIPPILQLKYAMDDFYERELPYIQNTSDSSVQLPISQLRGDYQTLKAELQFLALNEYNPPQLTVQEVERMGQNLRFLQKEARTLSPVTEGFTSSSSPSPSSSSSSSPSPSSSSRSSSSSSSSSPSSSRSPSSSSSSSSSPSSNKNPISFTNLEILSLKLAVEIARLTATGTTDSLVKARINIYTQIKSTVDTLISKVKDGSLDPTQIPISQSDYDAFLPSLGSGSAGPGGLLFNNGYSTLSSLFNSYQLGDLSGAKLAETLFNTYGDNLVNGLSYNVSLSYTSPNETTKEVAKALYRGEFQDTIDGFEEVEGFADMPLASLNKSNKGFNWKDKCSQLYSALKRMSLDPGDFGCLEPNTQVSPDYSWRGNAKMICTRAATHYDPALPEQIGCPPVGWKGWRS